MTKQLVDVGFNRAAKLYKSLGADSEKMSQAYELYKYVTRENMEQIDKKIRTTDDKNPSDRRVLSLVPIDESLNVPPEDVLHALETAVTDAIFDDFMVVSATGDTAVLLMGIINHCGDYFFIGKYDRIEGVDSSGSD